LSALGPDSEQRSDGGPSVNAPQDDSVLLRVQDAIKVYGGVNALRGVTFELASGEVHGLVGENGAGKSTLMRILAGLVMPDHGKIFINGETWPGFTQAEAIQHGIVIVPQEIAFVPRMSVAETIALMTHRFFARHGLIRWHTLYEWAQALLDEWQLDISARSPMSLLKPAQHITVSIVSALNLTVPIRTFILDEPTASFSPPEVEHLFQLVHRLQGEGRSIIYVTHRLDEVLEISNRVSVMRDGEMVGTFQTRDCTRASLVTSIVGHSLQPSSVHDLPDLGPVVLDVGGIGRGRIGPISFSVRQGEILGFAGLVGAGRTELFNLLYGLDKPEIGSLQLDGRKVRISTPAVAVRNRVALAPEERRAAGLVMTMSVRENVALTTLGRYARRFTRIIRKRSQLKEVKKRADDVNLRAASMEMRVRYLSGGNQQKVVIARCLSGDSRLLIFDEPARGVDVGAKAEIFELIRMAACNGAAVLVASSDTEELVGLCHRVLVMFEGRVVSELAGTEIVAEKIARLCFRPEASVGSE
jgi:ribose transport system ATP-binding protein